MTEQEKNRKINSLYEGWVRFGVRFSHTEPSAEEPYLEKLIAETSVFGRYSPRLMDGMLGWIQRCGDLIDISGMRENLCYGDSAVIGLLSDVVTSEAGQNFKQIGQYCVPKTEPEMLFYCALQSTIMMVNAMLKSTEINKKWNLYYVSLRIKTSALFHREHIFNNNHELARRAYSLAIT